MESDLVVVVYEAFDDGACFVGGCRLEAADRVAIESPVPAFDLAVGLGVVGGGSDVAHAGFPQENLEVAGDEGRATRNSPHPVEKLIAYKSFVRPPIRGSTRSWTPYPG